MNEYSSSQEYDSKMSREDYHNYVNELKLYGIEVLDDVNDPQYIAIEEEFGTRPRKQDPAKP